MEVSDPLAYLAGEWSLRRTIVDHGNCVTGRFEGDGRCRAVGRRGHYEEDGTLTFGARASHARRALQLIAVDGGTIDVRFADGRPFFELDLRAGRCDAVHHCGADLYELQFEVIGADRLLERWRVSGPAKDYAAQTLWRRRGGHACVGGAGDG